MVFDLETLCSVELVEEQSESVKQCGYLLSGVRVVMQIGVCMVLKKIVRFGRLRMDTLMGG